MLSKKDKKKICHTVDSNDIDKLNGTTCSDHDHIVMILDSNLCGVRIDNVTAADKGMYKCFVLGEEITNIYSRNITIDVAIPTKVIAYQSIRKIRSRQSSSHGNTMDLQCMEIEGYPKPTVSASLETIDLLNGQLLDTIPLNNISTSGNTSSFNIDITP